MQTATAAAAVAIAIGATNPSEPQPAAPLADLSHLDDAELDSYILSADEVAFRTAMWDDTHADYIRAQNDRRQQQQQQQHTEGDTSNNNSNEHNSADATNDAQANNTDSGRAGRGGGGGLGSVGSLTARKKDKLGASAFFLSATGVPASSGLASGGDAKPAGHGAAAAVGGGNVTSDVSFMLSASDIASSATKAANPALASHTAAVRAPQLLPMAAPVPQQQRRASGKINYQLLKGLLDSSSSNTQRDAAAISRSQPLTSVTQPSQPPQRDEEAADTADDGHSSAKRRKVRHEQTMDGREAEAEEKEEEDATAQHEQGMEEDDDEDDEEEEEEDQEAGEFSAAALMRAERLDDEYGSVDEADS